MPVLSYKFVAWFCTRTHVPGVSGGRFLGVLRDTCDSLFSSICTSCLRRGLPHCRSTIRCHRPVGTPSRSCLSVVSKVGDLFIPLRGMLRYWRVARAMLLLSRVRPGHVHDKPFDRFDGSLCSNVGLGVMSRRQTNGHSPHFAELYHFITCQIRAPIRGYLFPMVDIRTKLCLDFLR